MPRLTLNRPVILATFLAMVLAPAAIAQQDNPVYVDDSPQAWEIFRRARDQARDNTAESVRLYQELLDEFSLKLIPVHENEPDLLSAVRLRVLAALRGDAKLLERYRLIQTAEGQRMLEADRLEDLAMTRSLTEPGLEALLRLAQRDMEAARFHAAQTWLDEAMRHPDLAGRRAAHAQFMMALSAHHLDQPARLASAREALNLLGADGEAFAQQLVHLIQEVEVPPINEGITPLERGSASDLTDLVAQAIWTVPLEDSLLARRFATAQPQDEQTMVALQQRQRMADLTTSVPTVAGQTVYINEGHTVLALNRLTGRQNWSYSDMSRFDLAERDDDTPMDLNVVAVSGDSLVTLTGHAGNGVRTNQGRVICLDTTTGRPRWAASLSGLAGADTEAIFPHGVPIIIEGKVFVAARRVSPQLLTSAYVVCMDLADNGRVHWVQYITSSGGLRASPRPFCTIVEDPTTGSIIMSTAVGAIARMDADTGQVRWLRRYNVPLSQPVMDQNRRPWELAGPVVTPRGVLAVQPDQRRVVLLDHETGDQLESHAASTSEDWNSPRYLLADDDRVYAVGTEIRAFANEALEHPVWRYPPAAQQTTPDQAPDEPVEIRGRVQLVEGALIVPTDDGILVIDDETGAVKHKLSVDAIGNPLAIESQLLLACGNRLDSYMSFNRAERLLRERMSQAPDDPEPALSLLRLGMRVKNLTLVLESADLAMQAIGRVALQAQGEHRAGEARAELFALLLDAAASEVAANDEQGEQIFATISTVAMEPEQRVEYLLAYGDWQAQRSITKSVEAFQGVLSDPVLRGTIRTVGGSTREAGAWATDHLRSLIEQRGESVYSPQADFAQLRLSQLQGAPRTTAADLAALSREYPFAPAAAESVLASARMSILAGEPRAALSALARFIETSPASPAADRVLGLYVQICGSAGWEQMAATTLASIARTHPNLQLVSDSGSRSAAEWRNAFGSSFQMNRLPRIGAVPANGPSVAVQGAPGVMVRFAEFSDDQPPIDRVLLRRGAEMQLLTGTGLDTTWPVDRTTKLTEPHVLAMDGDRAILWGEAAPDDFRAVAVNMDDGDEVWTSFAMADLVANPAADLARIRSVNERMPDGEPFDRRQTLALVGREALIMVQRTGAVAALSMADGRSKLWANPQTLDQVHLAILSDSVLLLAGAARSADAGTHSGEGVPAVLALDPKTGEPLFANGSMLRPIGDGGVRWMTLGPMGRLVLGTPESIEAIDVFTGEQLWISTEFAAADSHHGWRDGDRLIIEDQRSRLRSVDVVRGTISNPFDHPGRSDWEPLDLKDVIFAADRVVAHYRQRVVVYDAHGVVIGADVITDNRDYAWVLPAQDRMVLISRLSVQAQPSELGGRRMQHVYRIYALSNNGRVLAEPLELQPLPERLYSARLIDGWLLLSTSSDTMQIPMPAD